MKTFAPVVLILAASVTFAAPPQTDTPTARDYFKELYAAGGLDRDTAAYVCFEEAPHPESDSFFIFARSEPLLMFLKAEGEFNKLPKEEQNLLDQGFVVI